MDRAILLPHPEDDARCCSLCFLQSSLPWFTTSKVPREQEACWTISNITAGTKEQIQSVVEADILPPLVHLLGTAGAAGPGQRQLAAWPPEPLCTHMRVCICALLKRAVHRRV